MSRAIGVSHLLRLTALGVALAACVSAPRLTTLEAEGGLSVDGGVVDGADTDGAAEAAPTDDAAAPVDCPATCNGGCTGTTCIVVPSGGGATCPAGFSCQVKCATGKACERTVTCAAGQPCVVECSTGKACDSLQIDGNGASSLCLRCTNGKDACNSVTCSSVSFCTKVCTPGNACNSTCDNCTTAAACP